MQRGRDHGIPGTVKHAERKGSQHTRYS